MASSTTMPSPIKKANMVSMLIVSPETHITAQVPSSEMGIPTATQKARRSCKKTISVMNTSTSPWMPFRVSSDRRS